MEFLQAPFVQTFAALLVYLVISSLIKYFETKGTNQATKEDIKDITKIAESIKSELSLINQHKFSFKTAEREALFEYNKKYNARIYYALRFNSSAYGIDNYLELDKITSEINRRSYECDIAEAHVTLFCHDDEFLRIKKEISLITIKLETLLDQTVTKIKLQYTLFEIDKGTNKPNLLELQKVMQKEIINLLENYHSQYIILFKELMKPNKEMTSYINKKINPEA